MKWERVLVTGGASGLGAAVIAAVAKLGAQPLVLDRNPPADGVEHQLVDLADTRAAGVVGFTHALVRRARPSVPAGSGYAAQ